MLRTLVTRPRVVLYGDQALIGLAARRAAHFDQLLGPYSRTGFHHPGPALFYLLAPFAGWGQSGSGLYLGASLINLAALVGAVAVVWRRLGVAAALWTAAVLDLFSLCLRVGTLREPWNPYLVVAPMVLFVVLWAAACTGSRPCAVWALVVGSYEVQTHLATGPVVVVLCAVMTVRILLETSAPARQSRHRSEAAGLLAFVALWVPVFVELLADHPDNVQKVWDYFSGPHASTGFGQALRLAGDALTVLPFGNTDYVLALQRAPLELAAGAVLTVACLVAATALGRLRQQPFALRMVEAAVAVAVVGTVSLTRSGGPVYIYFALWLSVVPVLALIGIGSALFGSGMPVNWNRERTRAALCATAIALSTWALATDLSLVPINRTSGSGPWPPADANTAQGRQRTVRDTATLDRAAVSALRRGDRAALLYIRSDSLWPYAAGVALALDERGVRTRVAPPQWSLYFGQAEMDNKKIGIEFTLVGAGQTAAAKGTDGGVIAKVDGALLVYRRLGH